MCFRPVCDPPEEGFAECCFEDDPVFYQITIIDYETKEETVSSAIISVVKTSCNSVMKADL